MGILDTYCRFCICELEQSRRRNIFSPENHHLLVTAKQCMALPMSEDDRYPNYICYQCAHKLNDITEFQQNGSSAVDYFDKFLLRNEVSTTRSENWLSRVNELFEDYNSADDQGFENDVKSEFDWSETREPAYELRNCYVAMRRCDDIFPVFKKHLSENPSMQLKNKIIYYCEKCSEGFSNKKKLIAHVRVHFPKKQNVIGPNNSKMNEKRYKCRICDKAFSCRSNRNCHEKVHSANAVQCEHCQKKFPCESRLITHMRSHTNEKPYECTFCQKAFNQSSNLVAHVRLHTNENKRFQCKLCEKSFHENKNLVLHMRSHTGERPFICEYCRKGFKQPAHLKAHVRIHTGERPFKCEICQKGFRVMFHLVEHRSCHSVVKLFSCEFCHKMFSIGSSLSRHKRKTHLKEKLASLSCKIE